MLLKWFGGQSEKYHIFHQILIGIIILIALYHISIIKIETTDQLLFFYIIMLECVGIAYEYYGV
jgi:hypothetical protein